MKIRLWPWGLAAALVCGLPVGHVGVGTASAQTPKPPPTSFSPVVPKETFAATVKRMTAEKPQIEKRHAALLEERYDLGNITLPQFEKPPLQVVTMSRSKPIQGGVRVKLPKGVTWDLLAGMSPEEVRDKGLWPAGFLPLPHPNHAEGGMLFPRHLIEEVKKQEERDLTRFDLDFDLPEHLLPEFPPPIFLTTRPDLGDVQQGQAGHHRQLP